MAQAFRLQVLLDLAQRRLDAATVELQRMRAAWQEAQTKLDQLKAYETEYATSLHTRMGQGISVAQLNDYRLFLAKLARAIETQGGEVQRRQRAWEAEHARWLQLKQRQQALEVLAQRHAAEQVVLEGRREQKQQDEFALKAGNSEALPR
jgi:flagellar protein FliJ